MNICLICKYYFQKNPILYQLFLKKAAVFPVSGKAALLRPHIYQNNIRPDAADAVPGDAKVLLFAHQTEKTAGAGDDNSADLPIGHLHHHIGDKAQPPPVADADHFLALQLGKSHRHTDPLPECFA